MTEQPKQRISKKAELNPYVSTLASKLMKTAANAEMKFDSSGWQLITEVLSYAASAEQRMAEQDERITFLEHLSVTDELTGITNRRGLRNSLGRTLAAAARHKETGVLGFLDLDGFKEVNDTHGHNAGDAILRKVAKCLKSHVRTDDVVARISGDEFATILSRCSPEQGRKRLLALQCELNNTTIKFGGETLTISCSIGIQHFDGSVDPAELIEAADLAMYEDKKSRKCSELKLA